MIDFRLTLAALAVGVIAVATSGSAAAEDYVAANAVSMCNGALPAYEGALRKRPLAIANEGTSSAFVTCSFPKGYNAAGNTDAVVYMVNRGTTDATVSCTFVDGIVAELNPTPPAYYAASVDIPAGEPGGIIWTAENEGVEFFSPYGNVNCSIPPKVELTLVGADYVEPEDLP
jgi:hypothetical protein